eukprot:g8737.t1
MMRKKYSQAALKQSAEGTSGLFSFFESKKRGRADEGKGLLGFLQDSAFVDAVKVEDLDEEEPLNWTPTVFSTSRVSAPDTSVEAHTSFVAELPRRPGHVAVRSVSSKGKGDLVMVIEKTLYNEAVDLYQGPYGREAKDRIESDPYEGVLPDRNGAPSFQYASEDDAIRAILETKQPYVDGLHKFLALSSFFRWQTPAKQRKMDAEMKATFTEDELLQYSSLFIEETGNTLPRIGVRVAHDNGKGTNVDYRARGFESDPKSLLTFDRGTIGGEQNGARKLLAIDSEEDMRLKTPEVAATTAEEKTMFVRLNDAAVLAARSETLFKKGSWLNKNVVGLAWVQGRGLSLVRTKEGTTLSGDPWVWLVTVIDNWEYCWSGPGFVMFTTHNWCFAGYKNLKKHDRKGANQMEVGRSGDFSTPSAKVNGKVNGPKSNFGMTANATVEGARAQGAAAEAAVEATHTAEEQTAAQRHLVDAIKRRKLVVKARQDQATGGAAASGKDCNQVGAGPNESKAAKKREGIPVHAGDEGAEEVSDIPASKSRKERDLCLGLSADGAGVVAKLKSSIDQRTGAILADRSLWCGIPNFKAPGHLTLGKGTWEEDENGNLVLGYRNTNDREGKTPRCYANTIPVTMVGKEWRVPEWALRYIRAGKVVQRNTNNQRHNGANKKARVKGNARK